MHDLQHGLADCSILYHHPSPVVPLDGRQFEHVALATDRTLALRRLVECDSPDANYEYVRKGLGVSWLPWSVVHADVKSGLLAPAGGKGLEVKFDVRMFRPKRRLSALAESLWSTIARR